MNPNTVTEFLQKGFRVTLGATSSLFETLQDPQKGAQTLSKMQSDFGGLTEEWAEKGALTEREARNFVDTLLSQQGQPRPEDTTETAGTAGTSSASPVTDPEDQNDLRELTAQIAALRAELERLQKQDSQP
ncbi:hypothetical protein [Kamptonema formosum]|uniref:hypothetical protein n=1 Tax=Kamptonema formosum TaxID=331992 RepID=UPI00034BB3BE|nr:hypothetical protein [Oscillatoria sp. PCC 10802]